MCWMSLWNIFTLTILWPCRCSCVTCLFFRTPHAHKWIQSMRERICLFMCQCEFDVSLRWHAHIRFYRHASSLKQCATQLYHCICVCANDTAPSRLSKFYNKQSHTAPLTTLLFILNWLCSFYAYIGLLFCLYDRQILHFFVKYAMSKSPSNSFAWVAKCNIWREKNTFCLCLFLSDYTCYMQLIFFILLIVCIQLDR